MLASSAITALVGQNINPNSQPQGGSRPVIVVTRISGAQLYADEGEVGLEDNRVQVDCYAETWTEADQLARAVEAYLSAVQDVTQGGTTFLYLMVDNKQDTRESGSNTDEYLHRVRLDFIVWFN